MSLKSSQLSLAVGGAATLAALAACTFILQKGKNDLSTANNSGDSSNDVGKVLLPPPQNKPTTESISAARHPISTPLVPSKGLPKDDTKKFSLSSVPGLIIGGCVTWISDEADHFWYKVQLENEGEQYMLCSSKGNDNTTTTSTADVTTGKKEGYEIITDADAAMTTVKELFDHQALCEALLAAGIKLEIKATSLSLSGMKVVEVKAQTSVSTSELDIEISFNVEGRYFTWHDACLSEQIDKQVDNENGSVLIAGGERHKKTSETGEPVHLEVLMVFGV
jgi:hypothetical protein